MPPKFKKSAASNKDGPVVLYWFRTDLRLHDSPALHHAINELKPSAFYPVWTWDPHYVYHARVGPNRWRFLLQCQLDVSDSIAKLNPKQKLHVIREKPTSVLPKLWKLWGITHLVFEKDTDAYARSRDKEVMKLAKDAGVEVVVRMGRTLWDPDDLVKANGGHPTMSMGQLLKAGEKVGKIQDVVPTIHHVPDPGCDVLKSLGELEDEHEEEEKEPDFNKAFRGGKGREDKTYVKLRGPKGGCEVPTLEEMGIDPELATSPHKGGEQEALRLLKKYIDDDEWMGSFEKPKSAPSNFEPQSTTLLSPHHHFGSLSVRKFWWDVQKCFAERKKKGKKNAPQPMNMEGQLLFRDMYFGAQAAIGWEFAQVRGNKAVRFVDWHLQSTHGDNGLLAGKYVVDDKDADEYYRRWKEGRTGFPWIDALMRQLKSEGWIHHLGRHAVACFLTRGGCYVHWERGAEVFEEWLIDHETACNVGNWMWLSCTAFFSQFYRCYSPIAFPKKWDPEANFVRKYVPELTNFDKKYIYEPHKAPIADQKKWGCQITGDGSDGKKGTYPKPMLDFNERRQFCIDKIKESYDRKLYGDNLKVMDGSWKKALGFDDKNGAVKDEADIGSHGTKRARPAGKDKVENGEDIDQGHMTDDGEHADTGDVSESEQPPKKAAKKGAKKGQPTLDTMVSRKKAKT